MKPISPDALRASLERALTHHNTQTDALSQDSFSAAYPDTPDWSIGPFHRDLSLTFTLAGQWKDPHSIGWTSSAIFNPTVIEHYGALHLFYRASPSKESVASRIGHAIRMPDSYWIDTVNPVIFETDDNEILGCEDPKLYRVGDRFYLFYNAVFPIDEDDRRAYPSPRTPLGEIGCDINLATSRDLWTWEKLGPVVPHEVSRLWAKGAVIPRDASGEAVKINGDYLMYVSEGCNGELVVGRSPDLVTWTFTPEPYLDLSPVGGHLHEVAAAIVDGSGNLVLDVFYGDLHSDPPGRFSACQVLYREDQPLVQVGLHRGGALPWGGLIRFDGSWLLAQGWDAEPGTRQIHFYRA